MKKINIYNGLWFILVIAIVCVDQVSKYSVIKHINLFEVIYLLPFLNFIHAHNPGAAFSFLANASGWQSVLFAIFAVIISIVTSFWILTLEVRQKWSACALSLICGGALGNLLDRLQHGYVIDFIDFHWRHYHFATFNIADSAISIGVTMLLLEILFGDK